MLFRSRLAVVKFEDLTADPVSIVEKIYRQFGLPDFERLRPKLTEKCGKNAPPSRAAALPPPAWQERLESQWAEIFNRYGYPTRC